MEDKNIGCTVAASMCGCALKEDPGAKAENKERRRLSDLRRINGKPIGKRTG